MIRDGRVEGNIGMIYRHCYPLLQTRNIIISQVDGFVNTLLPAACGATFVLAGLQATD